MRVPRSQATAWYIMFVAGCFVAIGMNVSGYHVIRTVGSEIAKIDFQRGFCIEFASTLTVRSDMG